MYGIDFGTTYTVVSYKEGDEVKYLNFNNSELLETEVDGIYNLKRLILSECVKKKLDNSLIEVLRKFFDFIYKEIEAQLGDYSEYKNCVITVPVRFNDLARNFIKTIAIASKFHIIKLLNEPVAAAIGTLNEKYEDGIYAVYDLGGGTFDATLIKLKDDMFHVQSIDGLENFGGIDIDKYISKKYQLSLFEANNFKKNNFVELSGILESTYKIIARMVGHQEIKGIILNGGSCYLQNIEDYFSKKYTIFKGENLQLMVSKGACVYCHDFVEKSKFLIDMTPLNLGIETLNGELSIIIPANSALPIIKTEQFIPVNNKVMINIYQGPSDKIIDATLLHSLNIKTADSFDIKFILDYDGILHVQVLDELISLNNFFNN